MEIVQHRGEFQLLTADELVALFKDDTLNVPSEDDACEAMLQWVAEEPETRAVDLPRLLDGLRLGLVSRGTLKDRLLSNRLVKHNKKARNLVEKGLALSTFREELCGIFLPGNPMMRPRVPSDVLFVVGGWPRYDANGAPQFSLHTAIETYDGRLQRWFQNEPHSYHDYLVAYHVTVILDRWVYVLGGGFGDPSSYYREARKFNPFSRKLKEIRPMNVRRGYLCAAVLEGQIYVCGGQDGRSIHKTAERYNPANNRWTYVASMLTARSRAGGCELNGKMYVAGGISDEEILNSTEVYDPRSDQWTAIEPMNFRRRGVAAVSFMNSVFAIGGFDGVQDLNLVERYIPEQRTWVQVGSMRHCRSHVAAAVMEQRIFAVGGYDGLVSHGAGSEPAVTSHTEWYDVRTDSWVKTAPLTVSRGGASACVMTGLENSRYYTLYGKEHKADVSAFSAVHSNDD